MTSLRGFLILPAASLLLTMLAIPVPAMASVSQCDNTSGEQIDGSGYQWRGYYTTNFANQGIEGYIDVDNLKVADPDSQHALLYLASQSETDSQASAGSDWVQVGYGVGDVDANVADVNHVYMEKSSYDAGPTATFYSYDTGNQFFSSFFTGETDSAGRGLYDGLYGTGSNSHVIAHAWHVAPTDVAFLAQFEGVTSATTLENCPLLNCKHSDPRARLTPRGRRRPGLAG